MIETQPAWDMYDSANVLEAKPMASMWMVLYRAGEGWECSQEMGETLPDAMDRYREGVASHGVHNVRLCVWFPVQTTVKVYVPNESWKRRQDEP